MEHTQLAHPPNGHGHYGVGHQDNPGALVNCQDQNGWGNCKSQGNTTEWTVDPGDIQLCGSTMGDQGVYPTPKVVNAQGTADHVFDAERDSSSTGSGQANSQCNRRVAVPQEPRGAEHAAIQDRPPSDTAHECSLARSGNEPASMRASQPLSAARSQTHQDADLVLQPGWFAKSEKPAQPLLCEMGPAGVSAAVQQVQGQGQCSPVTQQTMRIGIMALHTFLTGHGHGPRVVHSSYQAKIGAESGLGLIEEELGVEIEHGAQGSHFSSIDMSSSGGYLNVISVAQQTLMSTIQLVNKALQGIPQTGLHRERLPTLRVPHGSSSEAAAALAAVQNELSEAFERIGMLVERTAQLQTGAAPDVQPQGLYASSSHVKEGVGYDCMSTGMTATGPQRNQEASSVNGGEITQGTSVRGYFGCAF